MGRVELDKQGKYFWSLAKLAGWDNNRINKFLIKRYAATHWFALTPDQRTAAVATMRRYAQTGRVAANKRLRSKIMSTVAVNGHSKEWLYETLNIKPERTLSKMDYPELLEVYKSVKEMFPNNKKEEKR